MFRELTYTDVSRARAITDAEAAFCDGRRSLSRLLRPERTRRVGLSLPRDGRHATGTDDLLQEAFYRFLRAASAGPADRDRFGQRGTSAEFAYKIATNLATGCQTQKLHVPRPW